MADPATAAQTMTLSKMLIQSIPYILGTITGGGLTLIMSVYSHRKASQENDRKHQWEVEENVKKLKREKLEEILKLSYDYWDWLDRKTQEQLFDGKEVLIHYPFNNLRMISGIYFPELEPELKKLNDAGGKLHMFLVQEKQHLSEQRLASPEFTENYQQIIINLNKSLREFEQSAIELSPLYL